MDSCADVEGAMYTSRMQRSYHSLLIQNQESKSLLSTHVDMYKATMDTLRRLGSNNFALLRPSQVRVNLKPYL